MRRSRGLGDVYKRQHIPMSTNDKNVRKLVKKLIFIALLKRRQTLEN
jgi:hypothetical protein